MKSFLFSAVLLFSFNALAQDAQYPKHMISFGNDAFGFSAQAEKFKPEGSSAFQDLNIGVGDLNLNYAYSLTNRFQLGGSIGSSANKNEKKYKAGNEITEESTSTSFTIFGLYNFSDEINNAFYLGLALTGGSSKTESTDRNTPANNSEVKVGYAGSGLNFGKRFSLDKTFNIKNLVYSPSLSIYSIKYDKDFKDAGLEKSTGVILSPIKFDLLF